MKPFRIKSFTFYLSILFECVRVCSRAHSHLKINIYSEKYFYNINDELKQKASTHVDYFECFNDFEIFNIP